MKEQHYLCKPAHQRHLDTRHRWLTNIYFHMQYRGPPSAPHNIITVLPELILSFRKLKNDINTFIDYIKESGLIFETEDTCCSSVCRNKTKMCVTGINRRKYFNTTVAECVVCRECVETGPSARQDTPPSYSPASAVCYSCRPTLPDAAALQNVIPGLRYQSAAASTLTCMTEAIPW